MNIKSRTLLAVLLASVLMAAHKAHAEDERINSVSRLVAKVANGIGTSGLSNINTNWADNQEVKQLSRLTGYQRAAALHALIDYTTQNELDQLPFKPNDLATAATNLETRQISLTKIAFLTTQTDSESEISHYIKSELIDIRLVLDGKISYGVYFRTRLARNEVREAIVANNIPIANALAKIKSKEENSIKNLAGKTTLISLLDFCSRNLDTCSSIPEK